MPAEQQPLFPTSTPGTPAVAPPPVAELYPTVRTGTCRSCAAFVWRPLGERGVTWPCSACGGVVDVTNPAPYLSAVRRGGA
jgi:hypothetical protein